MSRIVYICKITFEQINDDDDDDDHASNGYTDSNS